MSWKATAAVKAIREGVTRTEKLVLLILSDYHNDRTGQCNPAVRDISDDALLGVRRTEQVLSAMDNKKRPNGRLIEIEGRDGGRSTAQYWLVCIGETPEKYSVVTRRESSPHPRSLPRQTPEADFGAPLKFPTDSYMKEPKEEPQRREPQGEQEDAPAHPFVVLYGAEYRKRNGRLVPNTDLANALLLEQDFGASACVEIARAYDWQKSPNYYRPILEERRNGNASRPSIGEPDEAENPAGVADGIPGLDRRSAAVARLGRGYKAAV